jgi:hypothetical protein
MQDAIAEEPEATAGSDQQHSGCWINLQASTFVPLSTREVLLYTLQTSNM